MICRSRFPSSIAPSPHANQFAHANTLACTAAPVKHDHRLVNDTEAARVRTVGTVARGAAGPDGESPGVCSGRVRDGALETVQRAIELPPREAVVDRQLEQPV